MNTDLLFTNGEKLKIGTIYCIGQNYSAHAREMGGNIPEEPIVFIKPQAAYMQGGSKIALPAFSNNIHHEVELVVVIGDNCAKVSRNESPRFIAGYAVGVDLTLRDVQNKAKEQGHPWAVSKGFYGSAPISRIIPAEGISRQELQFDLELKVNGTTKQRASTGDMERSIGDLIAYISDVFTLRQGDCIFTGTPEGVGRIVAGDRIEATLGNYVSLEFEVY